MRDLGYGIAENKKRAHVAVHDVQVAAVETGSLRM